MSKIRWTAGAAWRPHRALSLGVACLAALPGLLLPVLAAPTGALNDTGITDCYTDTAVDNTTGVDADTGTHPRQDCRYGRDAAVAAGVPKVGGGGKGFDFTKIDNSGNVAPASAVLGVGPTDWACTRDNVTGLVWEVKTTSGLRGMAHSYTWYSSDIASNGGVAGTPGGGICQTAGRCDTEKFVQDVNAAALCGATNWRLPTRKELASLVDFGRINPSIDPAYFPNTAAAEFWSSSVNALTPASAWAAYFYFGYTYATGASKSAPKQVRLVRPTP